MGAEGIRDLLRKLDLSGEMEQLRKELAATGSDTKIKKIAKALESVGRPSRSPVSSLTG